MRLLIGVIVARFGTQAEHQPSLTYFFLTSRLSHLKIDSPGKAKDRL